MLIIKLNRKLMIAITVIVLIFLGFSIYSIKENFIWKDYTNEEYQVSLKYPADWKPNPKYYDRYEGEEGFFQISAVSGEGLPIDKVTEFDAYHKLKPYGSNPQIEELKIQGQEARLILPSSDQPEEMANHAGLIIKYPTPVKIKCSTYNYFILSAHKDYIISIAKTLKFITKKKVTDNIYSNCVNLIFTPLIPR